MSGIQANVTFLTFFLGCGSFLY